MYNKVKFYFQHDFDIKYFQVHTHIHIYQATLY